MSRFNSPSPNSAHYDVSKYIIKTKTMLNSTVARVAIYEYCHKYLYFNELLSQIFLGKMIFIVSEPKYRQKKYKQMLYTTYIIIYKIQKYKINNTHHKT